MIQHYVGDLSNFSVGDSGSGVLVGKGQFVITIDRHLAHNTSSLGVTKLTALSTIKNRAFKRHSKTRHARTLTSNRPSQAGLQGNDQP